MIQEQQEEYRDMVGFAGYMVSNFGNVKRLPHTDIYERQGKLVKRNKPLKFLKPSKAIKGQDYLSVFLNTGPCQSKMMLVHRLVAMTFLPCPGEFTDFEVNHLDGNKANNHVVNLAWATHQENISYDFKTSRFSPYSGDGRRRGLTELQILTIHFLLIAGYKPRHIASYIGIKPHIIYNINARQSYRMTDWFNYCENNGLLTPE